MLIVQACEALFTGDGRYRMHQPSEALGALPGVTAIDCPVAHPSFPALARSADVLILQFFNAPELLPLVDERRAAGKATVFETADYYLDIQPWNPIAPYWRDPDLRRLNREFISRVDAVQVSTAPLAEHWRDIARRIVVFENQLKTVPPLPPARIGALTVGWAGSQGHLADWKTAARVLQPWFDRNPDTNAAVMGHVLAHSFLSLPPERYRTREAGILEHYFEFLPALDIGLAPLLPTEYNRCRSDVKFLEYAAYGAVGIYQNLEPYRATVRHGVTGFLFDTYDEMLHILDTVRHDHQLRTRVRDAAYRYVSEERTLEKKIGLRLDFYRTLLRCPGETEVDSALLEGARREGGYYQLSMDGDPGRMIEIISAKPTQEGAQQLFEMSSRRPGYHFLLEKLGRVLNDLKLPHEALSILSRAAELEPEAPGTRSELGRARLLTGDRDGGWAELRRAVDLLPEAVSSWGYLLRAARDRGTEEIREIIETLDRIHPHSIALAALSVELLSGADRFRRLEALLDRWKRILCPEELEFGSAIVPRLTAKICAESLLDGAASLAAAVELYPYSELLHELHARALEAQGRFIEADREWAEAQRLSRVAAQRSADGFVESDQSRYLRHIGDHIRAVLSPV